jgi:carbamoyl-phosphate synthase large subunit
METLSVGVSGINAIDNPGPGIGVARSLREDRGLSVRIVGLAYDAMEPGIYMDWMVDKSYIMPYPSGGGEAYVERLLQIKHAYGLDYLIPNLDAELPVCIKYADRLRDLGVSTFLPSLAQFRLRGKDQLQELGQRIGVQVPKTEVVTSFPMLVDAVQTIGFPLMVKGCLYKAHRACTMQEASLHFNELVAEWGYPVIVQEIVAGDELNVVGLGDGEGNAMGLVAIKKMWVTALGKMWAGVTVKNRPMLEAAEKFVRRACWRGPFELECIVAGDQVYLIEINPRFPAWVYLATGVGVNLPAQLLRRGLGLPPAEVTDYSAGKLFIRYSYDLVTDLDPFRKVMTTGEHAWQTTTSPP